MNIYIARPIAGLSYEEVANNYEDLRDVFLDYGFKDAYIAFCGKAYLKGCKEFTTTGYDQPLSKNHAITFRDRWMCQQADVVYLNLLGAKKVSIGCMFELAWAFDYGKHTVVVMEKDNIRNHAFVLEAAHVVYETEEEAMDYLRKLPKMEI